jgi:excisionase family DNA binding protein
MSRKKLWATSTTGEFLTPYEFAQRTNCSEAHIYRQLLAGRLDAIRIGTLWRLPVSQLTRQPRNEDDARPERGALLDSNSNEASEKAKPAARGSST